MVPLKYLSNFCRTLEMPLIKCEFNLILTWSANYLITTAASQAKAFAITLAKLYIPVATFPVVELKIMQQYYNN